MTRSCTLLVLCLFLFTACAAQRRGERKKQAALHYGMTHAQALSVIPNRSELLLGEFNFPEGHMQVFQYTRYGVDAFKVPKYYLYFLNDTLVRKSAEENLRDGAHWALKDHEKWLEGREDEAQLAEKRAAQEEKRAAEESRIRAREAERKAEIAKKKAEKAAEQAAKAQKKAEEAQQRIQEREAEQKQEAQTPKPEKPKKKKKAVQYDDNEDDW